MIKNFRSLPVLCLLLLISGSLLLNACTPTVVRPSSALKQQFALMQQQQQLQAAQLKHLQQQLEMLLKSPNAIAFSNTGQQPNPAAPERVSEQPVMIPASISQEVSTLADSASSYLAAFSNLAAGRYTVAETGFSNFLQEYPDHQYTPNARYWLAKAQMSQGKLQLASSNLRQVIVEIDNQQKTPAALVMLAKIYQQQELNNEADEVLEQLRSRYPESSEAQQPL